jgi:hypothetical protein
MDDADSWIRIMSKATKALVLVAADLLVATVGFGSQAASAAANGPPSLNVKSSCEAAADRTAMEQTSGANVRDVASCMRDENEARPARYGMGVVFSR